MHKNLHKNLYSKRNKKKNFPPVNKTIIPSENIANEIEDSVGVVNKKKYNLLGLLTNIFASGLIIFVYSIFSISSIN